MTTWQLGCQARAARLESGAKLAKGKVVEAGVSLLDRNQFLREEIRS